MLYAFCNLLREECGRDDSMRVIQAVLQLMLYLINILPFVHSQNFGSESLNIQYSKVNFSSSALTFA